LSAVTSYLPLPGGWRVSRVLLDALDAIIVHIELRKGARRAPLVMTVDVDITTESLLGKLPIGIDRELMAPRLVRMAISRRAHILRKAAMASHP
jgi:hypothetical protein